MFKKVILTCSIVLVTCSMTFAGEAKKDGLIFHAPMDGTTDASFSIGPAKALRGATGLTFVEGKFGKAVEIKGASRLSYRGANLNIEQGTIAMWIKRNTDWTDMRGVMLFHSQAGHVWNQNSVFLSVTPRNQFGITVYNSEKKAFIIGTPIGIPFKAGEWVHIAMTFTDGDVKLYLNGKESAYHAKCSPELEMPVGKPRDFNVCSNAFPKSVLNGALDDLRIYNRPLSAEEIAKLLTKKVEASQ